MAALFQMRSSLCQFDLYPSHIAEVGIVIPPDGYEKQSFLYLLNRYISPEVFVPPLHWMLCEWNLVWKFT